MYPPPRSSSLASSSTHFRLAFTKEQGAHRSIWVLAAAGGCWSASGPHGPNQSYDLSGLGLLQGGSQWASGSPVDSFLQSTGWDCVVEVCYSPWGDAAEESLEGISHGGWKGPLGGAFWAGGTDWMVRERSHTSVGQREHSVLGEGMQHEVSRWVSLLLHLPAAPQRASAWEGPNPP